MNIYAFVSYIRFVYLVVVKIMLQIIQPHTQFKGPHKQSSVNIKHGNRIIRPRCPSPDAFFSSNTTSPNWQYLYLGPSNVSVSLNSCVLDTWERCSLPSRLKAQTPSWPKSHIELPTFLWGCCGGRIID